MNHRTTETAPTKENLLLNFNHEHFNVSALAEYVMTRFAREELELDREGKVRWKRPWFDSGEFELARVDGTQD